SCIRRIRRVRRCSAWMRGRPLVPRRRFPPPPVPTVAAAPIETAAAGGAAGPPKGGEGGSKRTPGCFAAQQEGHPAEPHPRPTTDISRLSLHDALPIFVHSEDPARAPVLSVDAGAPARPPASLPAATCADRCGGSYRDCSGGCGDGASKACQVCLKTYRGCMRD